MCIEILLLLALFLVIVGMLSSGEKEGYQCNPSYKDNVEIISTTSDIAVGVYSKLEMINKFTDTALMFQTDGNLVMYKNGAPVWNSGTSGNSESKLSMQSDGNLVIYAKDGRPIWNASTSGNPGAIARFDATVPSLSIIGGYGNMIKTFKN